MYRQIPVLDFMKILIDLQSFFFFQWKAAPVQKSQLCRKVKTAHITSSVCEIYNLYRNSVDTVQRSVHIYSEFELFLQCLRSSLSHLFIFCAKEEKKLMRKSCRKVCQNRVRYPFINIFFYLKIMFFIVKFINVSTCFF